ncbi:hypothetical protein C436_21795 [Haloarcula marismortui ATCC 33800]|uniref:Uncharacterized protein n=1 Tax=Haloarcula marismortui ATCC 33800 TaxID=662476 RepID=M0JDT1_9EURY|nr:hypothetical protein C436_21795 [Haloarcula sinaiiensis ATCC 33800]
MLTLEGTLGERTSGGSGDRLEATGAGDEARQGTFGRGARRATSRDGRDQRADAQRGAKGAGSERRKWTSGERAARVDDRRRGATWRGRLDAARTGTVAVARRRRETGSTERSEVGNQRRGGRRWTDQERTTEGGGSIAKREGWGEVSRHGGTGRDCGGKTAGDGGENDEGDGEV